VGAVQLVSLQHCAKDFLLGTDIAPHRSFADWREQCARSRPIRGNRKKAECPAEVAAIAAAGGLGE